LRLEDLIETESTKGTYAGVRLSQDDEDTIIELVKKMEIPNPIERDAIHLTLLYSRKFLPDYEALGKVDMWAYPKGFHIFEGGNGKDILVLLVDSPDLEKRHKLLMKEHRATYDFPDFRPHITLSYDLEDFMRLRNKKSVLDNIKNEFDTILPKELHISMEYKEDLNLDWEK